MTTDLFELSRFVDAQRDVYEHALYEIRSGRKRSAQRFAINSLEEAKAYLAHPVLGPRLLECIEALNALEGRSASDVFGFPDDMKLRSCATLFAEASPQGSAFERLLEKHFEGRGDQKTLNLLSR